MALKWTVVQVSTRKPTLAALPTTCTEKYGFRGLSGPSFRYFLSSTLPSNLYWIRFQPLDISHIRSLCESFPPRRRHVRTTKHFTRDSEAAREHAALATHEAVVSGSDWQAPPNPLPQACDNLDNDPTRRGDVLCCWLSRTLPPTRPVTEARIRPLRSQPRARSPAEAASTQHPCQLVAPVAP